MNAITLTGLNYRKTRPINGVFGTKLGTWDEGTVVPVVKIYDDNWFESVWENQTVFASANPDYIQLLDDIDAAWIEKFEIRLTEILNRYDQILADFDKISIDFSEALADLALPLKKKTKIDTPDFSRRVVSRNGEWLGPVFSNLLGSHAQDHLDRGSVLAADITHKLNMPVYPVANGTVIYNANEQHKSHGYGIWTIIEHSHNNIQYYVYYCHLKTLPALKKGDIVRQNVSFGNIGLTGKTSWPHCHIEVHLAGYKGRQNPFTFWDINDFYYCKFCDASRFV